MAENNLAKPELVRTDKNAITPDDKKKAKARKAELEKIYGTSDPSQIAQINFNRFERAWTSGHEKYTKEAEKFDSFYCGEQWDEETLQKLKEQRRPALTINSILSTINTVVGEQTTNRIDVRFKPRRTGSKDVADTLTSLWLHVSDENEYDSLETQVFTDGLVQDRGYFDIRINFDDHLEGEIDIKAEDPTCVIPDPDGKDYDPSTWNEVTITKFLTLADIAANYGQDKADELRHLAINGDTFGRNSVITKDNRFGQESMESLGAQTLLSNDVEGKEVKAVRIVERQFYRYDMVRYFVDSETGDERMIPLHWDDAKVEMYRQAFKMFVVRRRQKRVRWLTTADSVVLHDDWSPYRSFTIVPYFPYFRRGKPFGMVRNLISPQEMLNKVSSQELHIVNTTANSGWIVDAGALTNMTLDELEQRGAETGLVIEKAHGKMVEKIDPNTVPTGLDLIGRKAAQNIKDISGVSDSMLGSESAEVSGIALKEKQTRGLIQIQVPLDNLKRTRRFVAKKVLELLQGFYTEHRMFNIADFRPGEPDREIEINAPVEGEDGTMGVMNDLTIGEYDVSISTMPSRDTFEDTQFAEMMTMRNVGVQIPDDDVIRFSHLHGKDKIADRVAQLMGIAPPTEEEVAEMERMQELQEQLQGLELKKLEAEVASLQAKTELERAKAQDTANSDSMELQQLEADLQKSREELELRMRLARIGAANKNNLGAMAAQAKLVSQNMANQAKAQEAKNKPAPATKK